MHRPYRHFDRITKAHQAQALARKAGRRKEKIGFLDLPLEVRLEIYRELRQPRPASYLNWEFENEPVSCQPFGFQTAVLRVNKQINAEAKLVFYSENTYVTILHAVDQTYGYDAVKIDRDRRRAALPFITKAHLRLVTAGEILFEDHEEVVQHMNTSVAVLCEDFTNAPKLKSLTISFRDDLYRQSWIPDGHLEDAGIDESGLQEMSYSLWDALEALASLPVTIALKTGGVSVVDTTDADETESGIRQEVLEEAFRSSFNEIVATRAWVRVVGKD